MRPDWSHPKRPVARPMSVGVRVLEVLVRMPSGSPPGGEFVLERLGADGRRLDLRALPLESAEAQALLDSGLAVALRAMLERRGELPHEAIDTPVASAPTEAEPPVLRLG